MIGSYKRRLERPRVFAAARPGGPGGSENAKCVGKTFVAANHRPTDQVGTLPVCVNENNLKSQI